MMAGKISYSSDEWQSVVAKASNGNSSIAPGKGSSISKTTLSNFRNLYTEQETIQTLVQRYREYAEQDTQKMSRVGHKKQADDEADARETMAGVNDRRSR